MLMLLLSLWCYLVQGNGEDIHTRAKHLLTNTDELFDMYKQHKEAKKTFSTSSLDYLLVDMMKHAEQQQEEEEVVVHEKPKHILTILTDDQGYKDIGYHDSTFITPTMDSLAHRGVKLTSFYVQNTCSPTRASLLTGRYLGQTGLQVMMMILNDLVLRFSHLFGDTCSFLSDTCAREGNDIIKECDLVMK